MIHKYSQFTLQYNEVCSFVITNVHCLKVTKPGQSKSGTLQNAEVVACVIWVVYFGCFVV
jgi:hypothetical protein